MTIKKFFPLPGRFGVMQIDPVAMVEHLGDEEALAAAKAMQPKRYIGYLRDTIELPWPQRPWYGYNVLPIATTLRPEDPEKGISSEMCVPIGPNTSHPTNRPSLATEPPFPFSNCYYWVDSHTNVRIRSGVEFDVSRAISLPHINRIDLQDMLDEDLSRAEDIVEEREEAEAAQHRSTTSRLNNEESRASERSSLARSSARSPSPSRQSACECSNCGASLHAPSSMRAPSVNSLVAMAPFDPFGFNEAEDALYFPLVDFCFDLTDHLTEDDISSPIDFWKERDAIVSIIKSAQERAFRRSSTSFDSQPSQEDVSPALDEAVLQEAIFRALSKTDVVSRKEGLQVAPSQGNVHEASQKITPKSTFLHSSRQRIQQHARQMADVLHIRNAVRRLRSGWRRASRVVALPYIPYWP